MSVRIAVSDPLPLVQRGIMAVLGDAGFQPEVPEDLLDWVREKQRRVVLFTPHAPERWKLLAELCDADADVLVVALLTETSVPTYVQAIESGAIAAVPRDAPPELVHQVFDAALEGKSLLPVEVVRVLAAPRTVREPEHQTGPSLREIEWLQQLAGGATVGQLADRAGYSERAMFRLLRELYGRIGVKNRTEALMRGKEEGWL
jgi:DNA-binding NarL/FixJ family response regulator